MVGVLIWLLWGVISAARHSRVPLPAVVIMLSIFAKCLNISIASTISILPLPVISPCLTPQIPLPHILQGGGGGSSSVGGSVVVVVGGSVSVAAANVVSIVVNVSADMICIDIIRKIIRFRMVLMIITPNNNRIFSHYTSKGQVFQVFLMKYQ